MFGLFKSKPKPKENLNEKPLTSVVPNAATVPTSNLVTTQVSTPPLTAQKKTGFLSSIKNKVSQTATTLIKGDPYNKFFENTTAIINIFKDNTDDNTVVDIINVKGKEIKIKELKEKYIKYIFSRYDRFFKVLRYFFDMYINEDTGNNIKNSYTIEPSVSITVPVKDISKDYKMFLFSNDKLYIYYPVNYQHNAYIVYSYDTRKSYITLNIKKELFEYINRKYSYMNFVLDAFNNIENFKNFYNKPSSFTSLHQNCSDDLCRQRYFYITEKGFSGNFPLYTESINHYTNGCDTNSGIYECDIHIIEGLHRIVALDVKSSGLYEYFYDANKNAYGFDTTYYDKHGYEQHRWKFYGGKKSLKNKSKKYKKTTQKNKKRRRRTLKR